MLPKLQDVPKQIILLRMRNGYSLFRGFASLGKGRCLSNCPNGYNKEMNPAGGYKKTDVGSGAFLPLSFLDYLISLPHEPNCLKFFFIMSLGWTFFNVPYLVALRNNLQ